jgi:hypothetical protein
MRSAPTRSLPIALLLGVIALFAGAAPAAAATIPIEGGEVDWGIKESFRNYVKGPIAGGQIETSGGAVEAADGTFVFPVSSGTYDLTTHVTEVESSGTVHFTGHYSGGVPALDVTITAPRVILGGATGTVFADVSSKAFTPGEPESFPNAEFAALDTSASPPDFEGDAVTVAGIPAELTEEGAEVFAGFYTPGTELDDVSVTAAFSPTAPPAGGGGTEEPKAEEPKTGEAPKAEGAKPADPAPSPAAVPAMPTLKSGGGAAKLGGGGAAAVATIACPSSEACTLKAPKNVAFKVGGRSFGAKVIAPHWILSGRSGKVAVKVPKAALEALGDGKATITLKLVLGTGSQTTTKVVKATLKGQGSR